MKQRKGGIGPDGQDGEGYTRVETRAAYQMSILSRELGTTTEVGRELATEVDVRFEGLPIGRSEYFPSLEGLLWRTGTSLSSGAGGWSLRWAEGGRPINRETV